MVDKIQKALNKPVDKEKKNIKRILLDIENGKLLGYDIKKFKGRKDIFRIRKGSIRIIYRIDESDSMHLLTIERRSDTTYNL